MEKVKLKRVAIIFTVITTIIAVISGVFNFLMPRYLAYKFSLDIPNASSVGIIGGADGPTAIYVVGQTNQGFSQFITIIFALLSVIGFLFIIFIKESVE